MSKRWMAYLCQHQLILLLSCTSLPHKLSSIFHASLIFPLVAGVFESDCWRQKWSCQQQGSVGQRQRLHWPAPTQLGQGHHGQADPGVREVGTEEAYRRPGERRQDGIPWGQKGDYLQSHHGFHKKHKWPLNKHKCVYSEKSPMFLVVHPKGGNKKHLHLINVLR